MTVAHVFSRVSGSLERAGIAWMLTGSFASNYYGAPRSTQDIDLVIAATPQQIRTFIGQLSENEYYFDLETAVEAAQRHSLFNIIDIATGWKIDLIFQKPGDFHHQAFQRRTRAELEGIPVFVATAEDVIIAKLEWAKTTESSQQITDIARILQVRREQLDQRHIEKWVTALELATGWKAALSQAGMPLDNPQP